MNDIFPENSRYSGAHLSKIQLDGDIMNKLLDWIKKPVGILSYLGTPGIGKTYFCAAAINNFRELKKKVLYKAERDFLSIIRNTISEPGGDYNYKVEVMADYDVIWIIDDIGTSQMTDWQKEVISTFIDFRYQNKKPLIITSNLWLNDMYQTFSPRFKSRLGASENIVIELNDVDKRTLGL